jgi:transposase
MTIPAMAEQLVPDEVWAAIQPLLPSKRPHPKSGRPWIEDRAVLGGIIYSGDASQVTEGRRALGNLGRRLAKRNLLRFQRSRAMAEVEVERGSAGLAEHTTCRRLSTPDRILRV